MKSSVVAGTSSSFASGAGIGSGVTPSNGPPPINAGLRLGGKTVAAFFPIPPFFTFSMPCIRSGRLTASICAMVASYLACCSGVIGVDAEGLSSIGPAAAVNAAATGAIREAARGYSAAKRSTPWLIPCVRVGDCKGPRVVYGASLVPAPCTISPVTGFCTSDCPA